MGNNTLSKAIPEQIEAKKPWYKQPWLWFVLSVPITSVILSSIMVSVAFIGGDTMVSDNYYKDGMGINQTIEQDQLADSLKLSPEVIMDNKDIIVRLLIKTRGETTLPQQAFLTLNIIHPTLKEQDVTLKLLPTADGLYIGELPSTFSGKRYFELLAFDESWRIREEVILPKSKFRLNKDISQQTN